MAQGLHYQISYSLSRDIGDHRPRPEPRRMPTTASASEPYGADIPTHRSREISFTSLPFGKGKRYLCGGQLRWCGPSLAGWQVDTIYSWTSGRLPQPHAWTGPDPDRHGVYDQHDARAGNDTAELPVRRQPARRPANGEPLVRQQRRSRAHAGLFRKRRQGRAQRVPA